MLQDREDLVRRNDRLQSRVQEQLVPMPRRRSHLFSCCGSVAGKMRICYAIQTGRALKPMDSG